MEKQARIKYILQVIDKKGRIAIDDIVARCNISQITARRDLEQLAGKGYIIRTHGGAIKDESFSHLFSFVRRMDNKSDKKMAISKYAAQYINDNETIFLDCGTTIFNLCHFINKKNNLQVITNSLSVASELAKYPQIKVTMIGGDILPERRAAYGLTAWNQINQYHADKAFIGTNGLSLTGGFSSYDDSEAQVVLAMAGAAEQVYMLCDSSKIENDSVYKFAPITLADYIITDKDLAPDIVSMYKKNNVNIITA